MKILGEVKSSALSNQCYGMGDNLNAGYFDRILFTTQSNKIPELCPVGNILDFLKKALGGVHAVGLDVAVLFVVGDAVRVKDT